MPDADPDANRVSELRSRWEADPSSRIFLQLAEEYRRQGLLREAIETLETGLERHPGYLSAQVALGRCHLEAGDAPAATRALEAVVAQDSMQMVASKLLVQAYLETGQRARARERLDLYALMNDSDPEIPTLRQQIEGEAAPAASEEAVTPAPGEEASAQEEVFRLPGEDGQPVVDLGSVEPPTQTPIPEVDLEPEPEPVGEPLPPATNPFADLVRPEDRLRYARGLSSEGIFPPLPEVHEESLEPLEVVVPVPSERPPASPEPAPASTGEEVASPAVTGAAVEPAATVTLGRLYLEQGHIDEAARIFREVLSKVPDNGSAREGLARTQALLDSRPAPPTERASEAPAAAPPPGEPAAAVPPAAAVAAEASGGGPMPSPADAAGGVEVPSALSSEGGAAGSELDPKLRKVAALRDYLKRIRQGAGSHVS